MQRNGSRKTKKHTSVWRTIFEKHRVFWREKTIRHRVVLSVALLLLGFVFAYFSKTYSGIYATGQPISDILLDHIPVVNVSIIFFQGAFLFILALVGIVLYEPKYLPFVVESSALFFIVRSFFVALTHLSSPGSLTYQYIEYTQNIQQIWFTVSSGNDLFFSGHAGYPFFLALIFWHMRRIRYFFLACSVVGAVAVIVGHLHYSIDVFSAYFIAYGIFEIAKRVFKKEYALL